MYCVLPHSGELTLREKAYFYGLLVGNFSWNAKVNQSGAASIPQIFSGENVSVVALKPQKESFFFSLESFPLYMLLLLFYRYTICGSCILL